MLRAYPKRYVFPIHRQEHGLLLPAAGVWVGTQRNSSHPPGPSGWVSYFIRDRVLGAGSGRLSES